MAILTIPTAEVFEPLLYPSRYKAAYGGRGSGKSHFFAGLLIETALMQPGLRAICLREVQRSLEQSVKRLLEDKIEEYKLGKQFKVMNTEIRTPGEGLIIFQGMQNHTADSVKSLEGYDIAWVEEGQNLSQRSIDLLRPTIRKPGSELWFSWNPENKDAPIERLFRHGEPPSGTVMVEASYMHNPWFPDVLKEEMEYDRRRDPEKYQHIWLGGYQRSSEARVFRNWEVKDFDTPDDVERFYFGADWGFSVDPSVLVRCWIDGRTLYVDYEAYKVGCAIDRTPELFDKVPEARQWPITADSARPETIDYMRRNGFPSMQAAKKGKDSVKDGVEFLKSYDIVVHSRCRHTIDELASYSYKVDKQTGDILPKLEDDKNHVIDALRYAVEGLRRAGNQHEVLIL